MIHRHNHTKADHKALVADIKRLGHAAVPVMLASRHGLAVSVVKQVIKQVLKQTHQPKQGD